MLGLESVEGGGVLYDAEIDDDADKDDIVEEDDDSEPSVVVELESSSTGGLLRSLVLGGEA